VADTYLVTHADVAAELPGLFPGGFTATTTPTDEQVASFITTADTIVTLRITDDVAESPSASDKAAVMARRYIIDWVKAMVLRIVYGGNDARQVSAAASPYEASAAAMLVAIDNLGLQAVGTGASSPQLQTSAPSTRELVLNDDDLDASARGGSDAGHVPRVDVCRGRGRDRSRPAGCRGARAGRQSGVATGRACIPGGDDSRVRE
jgi:hypothetical protein